MFVRIVVLIAVASAAQAQPLDLPPLGVGMPPRNPGNLSGTLVSKELQPTPDPLPAIPTNSSLPPVTGTSPAATQDTVTNNSVWYNADYLLWYPKSQPLQALAVRNDLGYFPAIDSPGGRTVIGPQSVRPTTNVPGGRFTVGAAVANQLDVEVSYFFLATRNNFYSTLDQVSGPFTSLGIPYFDAAANAERTTILRSPFDPIGDVRVFTNTRVSGWEALGSVPLMDVPMFRMTGLGGYRTFRTDEGLLIQGDYTLPVFRQNGLVTQTGRYLDEADTRNSFYGAMIGSRSRFDLARFFFELDSKISFGGVKQTVNRIGETRIDTPGISNVVTPAGVFVNANNAGMSSRTAFAVLPETAMKIGVNLGAANFYFGYTVLYLSEAVRPSDQLDRVVDPNAAAGPTALGRPSPAIVSSDFWVQGMNFGFQLRY